MLEIGVIVAVVAIWVAYALAKKHLSRDKKTSMTLDEFCDQFDEGMDKSAIAESYNILTRLSDSKLERCSKIHEDIGITDDDLIIEMNHFIKRYGMRSIFRSRYASHFPISTVDDFVKLLTEIMNENRLRRVGIHVEVWM